MRKIGAFIWYQKLHFNGWIQSDRVKPISSDPHKIWHSEIWNHHFSRLTQARKIKSRIISKGHLKNYMWSRVVTRAIIGLGNFHSPIWACVLWYLANDLARSISGIFNELYVPCAQNYRKWIDGSCQIRLVHDYFLSRKKNKNNHRAARLKSPVRTGLQGWNRPWGLGWDFEDWVAQPGTAGLVTTLMWSWSMVTGTTGWFLSLNNVFHNYNNKRRNGWAWILTI